MWSGDSLQNMVKTIWAFDSPSIKFVNGAEIRNNKDTKFIRDGHHYIYSFIPQAEIWVDVDLPEIDRTTAICHAIIERFLMRDLAQSHAIARDDSSFFSKLIRESKDFIFPEEILGD